MKRYSKIVVDHRYSVMQEDASGAWVPADVAQALYDALSGMLDIVSDSQGVIGYHLNGDSASWGEFAEVDYAAEALALADGKDNG